MGARNTKKAASRMKIHVLRHQITRVKESDESAVEPHAQEREQLVCVDRLGDVNGRTSLEALLPVAFHRLRRECEDRQCAELLFFPDAAHRLVAVHARHHDVHQHHAEIRCPLNQLDGLAAEGGADALELLDQKPEIDLVLMDIMMPGMDGYATMEAIRQRPQFGDLPIIAVTGKVVGGERERCIAAGASDYIPKPVDTAELLNAIGKWFTPAPRPDEPAL